MVFRRVAMICAAVGLAGCQALPDIGGVAGRISRATGESSAIVFIKNGEAVDVDLPGAGVLTAADAVRLALTHSPEIQAAFARVRQALAESKQTRLLPNPLLSVAFRLPEGGGSPTVEAALVADLVSLLRRPRKAGAADARVRGAVAEMLGVVLDTVAETEGRYTAAQALDAELAVLGERLAVVERLRGIAEARFRVGEAGRLDVLTLEAERAELVLEIEGKEAARVDERLALARLLGTPSVSGEWVLSPWTAPGEVGTEGAWVEAAMRHRPEIQARVWELAALGDEAALAGYAFLEGNGGLSAERDGEWTVGPAIDIPIPVFDWGQARREKADAQVMEARHRLVASRRQAVEEVRRAWATVAAARRLIARAEAELLPVQERRLAQAEAQYRNGQADVTAMLLAQQDAQAGRSRLVELQKNLALAQSRLYRAAGGAGVAPSRMSGLPIRRQANYYRSEGMYMKLFLSVVFGGLCFSLSFAAAGGAEGHGEAAGGHADEVKLTAEAVRANGITTASASKMVLTATFVTPGRVNFNAEAVAHVGGPVKGRVVELKARIGQKVEKGEALFVVESAELGEAQSELIQKKAGAGVAESAVAPARESYERAKKLFEENQGISLAEVQRRQAEWVATQGAVKTAAAAVAAAENRLQLMGMEEEAIEVLVAGGKIAPRYSVVAPIAGQVIEREVTQGELVSPDRDSLMVLADMSVVWVWADVPEMRLAEIVEGSVAMVFTAGAKEAIVGKVTHIAPQLDAGTRTAKARIEIGNGEGKLRPGMFARVELEVSGKEKGEAEVVVPEGAVQMVEGKPAVFVPVEGEAHTFATRGVKVGKAVGGVVPVHAGLKEGETYVVTGSFILKADLGKSGAAHEH